MARILIVGEGAEPDGARGASLAEALAARGHAVKTLPEPDNLGAILPELQGVSALAWLGGPELLESLAAKLVDTHVRGAVYEAGGSVEPAMLDGGAAIARDRRERFRMPVEVVHADPGHHPLWRSAMVMAVERVLAA